jgi:protease I
MGDVRLNGKKIAILVENEFIPEEITAYQSRFGGLGADVHFMSRLWGQERLTFISDLDQISGSLEATREKLRSFDVSIDIQNVNLNDYAAVLICANYCSVRLRYFQPPPGQPIGPELVGTAPAVAFYAEAMKDPWIVKGALCHGLWLLTPRPDLLRGRRVICHEVVLADIANAGAIYTPSPDNVVVDRDLVTGRAWHDVEPYIDAIAKQIVRLEEGRATSSRRG